MIEIPTIARPKQPRRVTNTMATKQQLFKLTKAKPPMWALFMIADAAPRYTHF